MVMILAGLIGSALLLVTFERMGLGLGVAVLALLAVAMFVLPFGAVACGRLTRMLPAGERWMLAGLVGYPIGSALYHLASWAGAPALCLLAWLAAAGMALRRWPREREAAPVPRSATLPWLLVIVPCLLLLSTSGARAFQPRPGGALAYRHSVDHSVHLAFYWEMVRGFPPQQVPTAAGLPFPSYHTLSFAPGVLLVRYAGLNVTTVYHAISPLLRLALLMGALYVTVRLRTGREPLAVAALPAVLVIGPWLELLLAERVLTLPSPFFLFQRNESNGGGIVVWAAVAALLALYQRHSLAGALPLAALLAGVAVGFKAQIFLLFAPAFFLVLVWQLVRTRAGHVAAALLLGLAAFAVTFLTSRGAGPLGELRFTPGLLARLYVYPTLAHDPSPWVHHHLLRFLVNLPAGADVVAATALALWRLTGFSLAVPVIVVECLRRLGSAGPLDRVVVGAFLLALPLGMGLSAVGMDQAATPLEFVQGAQALTFCAAVMNVIGFAALVDRLGGDGARITRSVVLLLSAAVAPRLLLTPAPVPPRESVVLSRDELCALRFLRDHTPLDAVTIAWHDEPTEDGGSPKRLNHQAVLAGLGGRRSVLEYYGPETDPTNDREEAVRRLFTTTDAALGEQVLDRYRVSYVVEFDARPLRFQSPRLESVYSSGAVRVQHVRRDGSASSDRRPPRAWADAPDFACEAAGH